MAVYGKAQRYIHGYAIHCRCGLIFIGDPFDNRYEEHTWKCEITLRAVEELNEIMKGQLNGITN